MIHSESKAILSILKALGSPIRLNILRQLNGGEQCVCSIFEKQKLSQNLASHHLAILKKSGVIISRKEGKWVHYSLNPEKLVQLREYIECIFLSEEKGRKSKC